MPSSLARNVQMHEYPLLALTKSLRPWENHPATLQHTLCILPSVAAQDLSVK